VQNSSQTASKSWKAGESSILWNVIPDSVRGSPFSREEPRLEADMKNGKNVVFFAAYFLLSTSYFLVFY